ncbi:MAG: DUF4157 domain-containing protein [Acidobacteria bacterium]|nr:DUF4157 domain-containing protein [Acidobacteriota bacterium]
MQLSRAAHKLFEDFFCQRGHCNRQDFPEIEIYAKRGSWLITNLIMVDGITFGRYVFVNPGLTERDEKRVLRVSKILIAHEMAHVLQYQRLGFSRFMKSYLSDFLRIFVKKDKWNLQTWFESYSEIPHEVEARRIASEFSVWLKTKETGS